MNGWRIRWLTLVLAAVAAGCVDGGRGSSGFDISENAAITRVLETQECISGEHLTLCPADQMATPSPTPAPTAPTPTMPQGPTATPTPVTAQRVDTGLTSETTITCLRRDPLSPCDTRFAFTVFGFPPDAVFHVASRLLMPSTKWGLAPQPRVNSGRGGSEYETTVSLDVPPDPDATRVQFSVLVFLTEPAAIPASFDELADSGADLAFVTPELALDAATPAVSPTPTELDGTPSPTASSAASPTTSSAPTPTATPTASPSPTAVPGSGPELTHLGLARADNEPMEPIGVDEDGRPIYYNRVAQGMTLIVEARPGIDRRPPGVNGYNPDGLPDLQVIASKPLGNGSANVCDIQGTTIGGIPATEPFEFGDTAAAIAAINDFGCRVNDGTGQTQARVTSSDACTFSDAPNSSGFGFVNRDSTVQFCLPIARAWSFPVGDTMVAARVRNASGAIGSAGEIVVRVADNAEPPRLCERGEEERVFTLARPASMLVTSFIGGDVSADPWPEEPLRLCLGTEDEGGRRSIHLRSDGTLVVPVLDGSFLCVRLTALGSDGRIDCAGGAAHDVAVSQESNGGSVGRVPIVETGLGDDAGPGAATLTVPTGIFLFPKGTPPSRCSDRIFPSPSTMALTTATATAHVDDPIQGGTVSISARGENFDCAHLTQTDGPGVFVLPFTGIDGIVVDTADALVLSDR